MNARSKSNAFLAWLDDRTGVAEAMQRCSAGPRCGSFWPGLIVFTFVVQLLTGFVLWMYYSPSAQSAWESVYYIQYEVTGGWLLRGIHHYAAQVLVVLLGLYLIQLVLFGRYRKPREFVFWTALLLGLMALALCLTGDLLTWSQNGYSATQTRVSFLMLLPGIGGSLYKLAAGGPAFGHLTVTRFFALHVGVFVAAFLVLLVLHLVFRRRAAVPGGTSEPATRSWLLPLVAKTLGCLAVLGIVLLLVFQHGLKGDHAGGHPGDYLGVPLGAPADPDPANAYAAARPEWSFRGLYELTHKFSGAWQIVPIFVLPSLVMTYVFLIPFVGRSLIGHVLNVVVVIGLVGGLAFLSYESYRTDFADRSYLADVAKGAERAQRVVQLAQAKGIPATGALSLLRDDPKTQGPAIYAQHCGACHPCSAPKDAITPETPAAAELYPFASRPWLAGLLDKKQIKSSRYFGHTRFASGIMVKYVEADFASVDEADRTAIVAALSAEARLPSQAEADARDKDLIAKGRELIASTGCTRCHRFREHGVTGEAPDLTGYGSREWLIGITADPTHPWFYAERNDGMPAHVESPEEPAKNRLSERQVETLVSWMRGEWFEPGAGSGQSAASQAPVAVTLGKWLARRGARETRVADAKGQALGVLRLAQCALCHDCSGVGGEGLAARQPSAPSLSGYASAEWFRGLLDPTQVAGPKYFGTNDEFADGEMVGFVQDDLKDNMISAGEIALEDMISEAAENEKQVEFALQHLAELKPQIGEEELRKRADEAVKSDKFEDFVKENGKTLIERLGQEKLEQLIATLAAEAQKDTSAEVAEDTEALFEDLGCADCHKFYNAGELGSAPDLTGYGSQQWLIGIITNPEEERFYRSKNDGMPAYHAFPKEPKKNLLTPEQIEQLAALLRGKL